MFIARIIHWAIWCYLSLACFIIAGCNPISRVSPEERADAISRTVAIAITSASDEQINEGRFRFYGSTGILLGDDLLLMTRHGIQPYVDGDLPRLFLNKSEAQTEEISSSSKEDLSEARFQHETISAGTWSPAWPGIKQATECPAIDIPARQKLYVVTPYRLYPQRYVPSFVEAIRVQPNPPLPAPMFERWDFTIMIEPSDLGRIEDFPGWSGCPVFCVVDRRLQLVGLLSEGVMAKKTDKSEVLLLRVAAIGSTPPN